MRLRRLSSPLVVVVTGVENAGKTTLCASAAGIQGWDMISEAARRDPAVTEGRTQWKDLQRLQDAFIEAVQEHTAQTDSPVLLCDTGGLVLDMWAREVFGQGLERTEEAMALADLHLLCHTLPEWHPDPLRTLPNHLERLDLHERYRAQLERSGHPFIEIPVTSTAARTVHFVNAITQHLPA